MCLLYGVLEKKNFGCRVLDSSSFPGDVARSSVVLVCLCVLRPSCCLIDIADLDENSQRILPTENMRRLNTMNTSSLLAATSYEKSTSTFVSKYEYCRFDGNATVV